MKDPEVPGNSTSFCPYGVKVNGALRDVSYIVAHTSGDYMFSAGSSV